MALKLQEVIDDIKPVSGAWRLKASRENADFRGCRGD